jgi:hypothetical protein
MAKYPFAEFQSIDDLCGLIEAGTKGWDTKWFRGVQSPSYSLLPKILRDKFQKEREGYISVEFRRRARAHLALTNSPFEWLCAMQHYGIPTRLLDWSESLPVALYFCFKPVDPENPPLPTIWVMDPYQLNGFSGRSDKIIEIASGKAVCANADIAFNEDEEGVHGKPTKHPIPVVPDFIFNRLAIQNGAFTLHGTSAEPLEQVIPMEKRKMLLKFVAKKEHLTEILQTLSLIAPSPDAIFPDLEGIKDYIG